MNLIKHILTAFYKSFYDFKWMAAQRQSFWRALVYFFVFFLIVVGVRGWVFVQDVPGVVLGYWESIETELPEFSVEKTEDGLALTGLEQPYEHVFEEEGGDVVLYIDTVSTSSISVEEVLGADKDRYGIILTSKKFKFYDPTTERTEIEDISQLPEFSVTKAQINEEVAAWADKLFPGVFIAGVVFFTVFLGVGKLIYLLILAWLVYVIARADKKPWTFGQVYTIGLYALSAAILFQLVVSLFEIQIPYVYSVLALVMMYVTVYKGMPGKQEAPPASDPSDTPASPKK